MKKLLYIAGLGLLSLSISSFAGLKQFTIDNLIPFTTPPYYSSCLAPDQATEGYLTPSDKNNYDNSLNNPPIPSSTSIPSPVYGALLGYPNSCQKLYPAGNFPRSNTLTSTANTSAQPYTQDQLNRIKQDKQAYAYAHYARGTYLIKYRKPDSTQTSGYSWKYCILPYYWTVSITAYIPNNSNDTPLYYRTVTQTPMTVNRKGSQYSTTPDTDWIPMNNGVSVSSKEKSQYDLAIKEMALKRYLQNDKQSSNNVFACPIDDSEGNFGSGTPTDLPVLNHETGAMDHFHVTNPSVMQDTNLPFNSYCVCPEAELIGS